MPTVHNTLYLCVGSCELESWRIAIHVDTLPNPFYGRIIGGVWVMLDECLVTVGQYNSCEISVGECWLSKLVE